eukprot:scaffold85726_cov31-Tisochrysis_lutea.AAC.1
MQENRIQQVRRLFARIRGCIPRQHGSSVRVKELKQEAEAEAEAFRVVEQAMVQAQEVATAAMGAARDAAKAQAAVAAIAADALDAIGNAGTEITTPSSKGVTQAASGEAAEGVVIDAAAVATSDDNLGGVAVMDVMAGVDSLAESAAAAAERAIELANQASTAQLLADGGGLHAPDDAVEENETSNAGARSRVVESTFACEPDGIGGHQRLDSEQPDESTLREPVGNNTNCRREMK